MHKIIIDTTSKYPVQYGQENDTASTDYNMWPPKQVDWHEDGYEVCTVIPFNEAQRRINLRIKSKIAKKNAKKARKVNRKRR